MVFADLIESEDDFKEYIDYRIDLYERNNIEFHDEIDILGFFMEGNFPLKEEDKEMSNQAYHIRPDYLPNISMNGDEHSWLCFYANQF